MKDEKFHHKNTLVLCQNFRAIGEKHWFLLLRNAPGVIMYDKW